MSLGLQRSQHLKKRFDKIQRHRAIAQIERASLFFCAGAREMAVIFEEEGCLLS